MIRLNHTLMQEEQLEHALAQERDMQAAIDLETAENDEMQYAVALLEERDGQFEEALPPCDQLGSWALLGSSVRRCFPSGSYANAASSSSAASVFVPVPFHDVPQVVPDPQALEVVPLSNSNRPGRDASASQPQAATEW